MKLIWRPAVLLALFLGLAGVAEAQTLTGSYVGSGGGTWGTALDIEGGIGGDWLHIAGMAAAVSSDTYEHQFFGAGPRVRWTRGRVSVYGHVMGGGREVLGEQAPSWRAGGGLDVRAGSWLVRFGLDRDGDGERVHQLVGIGYRW